MHVSLLLQFVVGSTPKWRRMTGLDGNITDNTGLHLQDEHSQNYTVCGIRCHSTLAS